MMTTQALERAARAIVAAEQDQWDLPAEEWDMETLERHGLIKIARAVLMAVREPTPKMINATWNHPVDRDGGIESQNTRNERIYKAMIDAILGEGEGE